MAFKKDPKRNNRISRRDFLKLTGAAAATLPFASQFLPGNAALARAQAVDLSMWTWYEEQKDEFPKLDEEFNKMQSKIRVQSRVYGGSSEYLPVLEAAIAGGKAPDIFGPHVHAVEYGKAGQTVDLIPLLGEPFMKEFFPSTRRQFTADGKQYAIGWMAQTFGFFYNPPLFEKAGIKGTPETWDDLIAAATELKKSGVIPWTFNESDKWLGADFFLPLITQVTDNPDLLYDLDEHTKSGVSWDSDPIIESLKLVDKLVKAGVFQEGVAGTDWEQSTATFYAGKAAMMFAGSWVPQGIVQNASPEFAKTYRVFKTPSWAKDKRHWCGNQAGAALAVNVKGKVNEAIEFIKFLYDADRYARTMNNTLSMPSTSTTAAKVTDPIMKEMTSWLPDGAPHILFGKGSWDAVSNAVQGVFAQTLKPEEAAKQMEADVVAARSR